ncbi:MAG: hypothetical protein ABIH52_00635 [Candidatus Aenigmatarchaeota archaeon]|nr:hypothetical protein [Nanoarchaeota archaeon]
MKGFIHVVEIIIISIVMFFILMQFSTIPNIDTDWDRTKLYLVGNDLAHTLDNMNVDWSDDGEIKGIMDSMVQNGLLSENILYDVKLRDSNGDVTTIIHSQLNNPVTVSMYEAIDNGGLEFREVLFSVGYLF